VYFKKILLYGHDPQPAKMKLLREIVGKNRRDRIRNIHIRGRSQDGRSTELSYKVD
jgi:hypothetical protein